MEFLQLCLKNTFPHEEEVKKKVAQMIEKLDSDVCDGKIPFTEEHLNTIQDVFGMTVKAKYGVEIIRKTKVILAYFYEEVRRVDNTERMIHQQKAEENRKNISTQFPENEEVINTATTRINKYFLQLSFESRHGIASIQENVKPGKKRRGHVRRDQRVDNTQETEAEKKLRLRRKYLARRI